MPEGLALDGGRAGTLLRPRIVLVLDINHQAFVRQAQGFGLRFLLDSSRRFRRIRSAVVGWFRSAAIRK